MAVERPSMSTTGSLFSGGTGIGGSSASADYHSAVSSEDADFRALRCTHLGVAPWLRVLRLLRVSRAECSRSDSRIGQPKKSTDRQQPARGQVGWALPLGGRRFVVCPNGGRYAALMLPQGSDGQSPRSSWPPMNVARPITFRVLSGAASLIERLRWIPPTRWPWIALALAMLGITAWLSATTAAWLIGNWSSDSRPEQAATLGEPVPDLDVAHGVFEPGYGSGGSIGWGS